MIPHAQLAADFHLAQGPTDEGAKRADRDDLPQPAVHQRGQTQTVFQVRRRDIDKPWIEGALLRGPPENQDGPEQREKGRRDAKKAHVKWSDPKVEQIAANQRPPADPVLSFETEQSHFRSLRVFGLSTRTMRPGGPFKIRIGSRGRATPPAAIGGAQLSAPVLLGRDFKPVETVGAQKHEVNHCCEQEQKRPLRHEDAAGVENEPDFVKLSHCSNPSLKTKETKERSRYARPLRSV